jgi:isoleucyl-tRNA synthetase
MSWEILKERAEPYKKIRNTFKYILGSIHDFDPSKDAVQDLLDIDRWALAELSGLVKRVTQHYENYQFFRAFSEMYQFCNVEMSAVYFDIIKDRLYCSGRASRERRSGQTVLHEVLLALVKMFAPMICHTTEETWGYLPKKEADSVHLALWPQAPAVEKDPKWDRIFKVRTEVQRELEKLRAAKTIGKSLKAKVTLHSADAETLKALKSIDLTSALIVSEALIADTAVGAESADVKGLSVKVESSTHPECERCWNLRADVGRDSSYPTLCGRCAAVIKSDFPHLK